jgi:EAL domain-containing protein (putative c-di-GMP-specific phosphodiesterase class I)/GGDEF domain-containing protein
MNPAHPGTHADQAALWDWNLLSGRIHFSAHWVALVGCEEHEIGTAPQEWLDRVHPDDLPELSSGIASAKVATAGEFESSHRLRHKDGTYRWTRCRWVVTRDQDGVATGMRGAHENVTAGLATDTITGLPNRLLLVDRLTRSLAEAGRNPHFQCALLVVALGRPRVTNALLSAVARRLESGVRVLETMPGHSCRGLVASTSGDTFAVLLDNLNDLSDAKVLGDRLLVQMLAPFSVNGAEELLPVSIGVAVSGTGYSRPDQMLHDAGTALHRAQVLGGSHCAVFDTALLKLAQTGQLLERDLEDAIGRDELLLAYQPIVSLDSNQVVGFEALVRWRHPVLGMIAPADFIAIAERTGMILRLGEWTLRTACAQLKSWQLEGLPGTADLWVSVNLSPVQLKDTALIEQVTQALLDTRLDARGLVLELTEGVAMENPTAVKDLLMRLRSMGVRISIDDFGTGYSSLSYLRQFPVDSLKIDRSFVHGIENRQDMVSILETLTSMSQQLGLQVVAEGIENEAQASLLRSLQCHSAQGYLFAEPLDVTEAARLLRDGVPDRRHGDAEGHDSGAAAGEPGLPLLAAGDSRGESRLGLWISAVVVTVIAGAAGVVHLGDPGRAVRTNGAGVTVDSPREPEEASRPVALSGPPPLVVPAPVASLPAVESPVVAPPAKPVPARQVPAERRSPGIKVMHQHRIGSCEGLLVVSRDGVAFVPDDASGKDALTLRPADFLPTLDNDTLTLKTTSRTYRFKHVRAAGEPESTKPFEEALKTISRFR